jgi:hypothetical protein
LLVPREEADDLGEVEDLAEPLLQTLERVSHLRERIYAAERSTLCTGARSSVDRAADF